MLCLAAGAGCLLPVPFFLSVDTTLEAVSQLEMSKPLAAVGDFTESGVEFITGRCPKRNAVGEVTLYMGDDVNDSANRAVWNENQWATRHVISKSIEDAFDVKHVLQGRFSYPTPTGMGNWQTRLAPESTELIESGWYLPPTEQAPLEVCKLNLAEEIIFYRGFSYKSFQRLAYSLYVSLALYSHNKR